ncbi:MAG: hypothetical protein FWE71_01595 [Nocardioidaceae bacterium]|nr:hypothetical protein [Nocardioidaceae bacterium]MCL2613444.1 hypothetical protein [Nocardioidaceae bacterium]
MTWKAFHNRGETLRSVIATAAVRKDGILPMDLDGVSETFRDELDLLSALQLKWHTRLSGNIERQMLSQPMDLEQRVVLGWRQTADELVGVRLILDNYCANPIDEAMAHAVRIATAKEHQYLAVMAGRSGLDDATSTRIGADIEAWGRDLHRGVAGVIVPADDEQPEPRGSLIERLRAVLAA